MEVLAVFGDVPPLLQDDGYLIPVHPTMQAWSLAPRLRSSMPHLLLPKQIDPRRNYRPGAKCPTLQGGPRDSLCSVVGKDRMVMEADAENAHIVLQVLQGTFLMTGLNPLPAGDGGIRCAGARRRSRNQTVNLIDGVLHGRCPEKFGDQ